MKVAPTKAKRRVSPEVAERKARFRIALAHARITAERWAKENDIDPTYLSRFLAGRTVSGPLDKKIAAFTQKYLRNVA